MKTLQIFVLSLFTVILSLNAAAQSKTETFAVSGECGMCKKKIETAAKAAGASYAVWNVSSKKLTVKFTEASNAAKIQQHIAESGYDTPTAKATDDAYNNLHECCKYDRTATTETAACCAKDATCCTDQTCCTDGTCTHDKTSTATATPSSCCSKQKS